MEKKELKERFFDRFFYAEDGSCDWDRWRKQDPSVVLEFILEELDRAREEVLLELLEKKTNYKIEEVGHGYKVTQEYVLVSDIEKELSKLKSKQEWKRR